MPSITPIARQVIGGTPENTFQQPRKTLNASTGMNVAPREQVTTLPEPKIGQPITNEADTAQSTPTAVTLSPQLTALARKQQKFQQDLQTFNTDKTAFEAAKADYVPKSQIKDRLNTNVAEGLQELGYTFEQLTELYLAQQSGSDPNAQVIKDLADKITKIETDSETAATKQRELTLNQYRKEIENLVSNNPDFDTIKSLKRQDAVLQHIVDTFDEDGEVLTVEEASKEIEDYLVEEAMQMAGLNKVKSKMQPAPSAESTEKKLPAPKTGLRTLTQAVSSTPPARTANQFQHLSMKERIAQSIARAQR